MGIVRIKVLDRLLVALQPPECPAREHQKVNSLLSNLSKVLSSTHPYTRIVSPSRLIGLFRGRNHTVAVFLNGPPAFYILHTHADTTETTGELAKNHL
jgi:hypothetical protein